jgi:hypothetical protein
MNIFYCEIFINSMISFQGFVEEHKISLLPDGGAANLRHFMY